MGKQRKARKTERIGKGKVTPVQIAFIVDRYLSDSDYSRTRSVFRTEASSLMSRSPVHEAPKSLLSLGAMLDEYIQLKEQRVMLDQEKACLEQEALRVQSLLQGMQGVMNAYNVGGGANPPPPPPMILGSAAAAKPMVMASSLTQSIGSPAGYSMYNTSIANSVPMPSNTSMEVTNFSTPVTHHPSVYKRKRSKAPDPNLAAKKSHGQFSPKDLPSKVADIDALKQSSEVGNNRRIKEISQVNTSPHNRLPSESLANGSSVAKNLFAQPSTSAPTTSSGPTTPPQSPCSQKSDDSISPPEISSSTNAAEINPSQGDPSVSCTGIYSSASELSPPKEADLKRPTKRDHVKGRLDFDGSNVLMTSDNPMADGSSASESEKDFGIFDIDLPNLDGFGVIPELFVDFDINCEGIGFSCKPALNMCADSIPESPQSKDGSVATKRVLSAVSSTEILAERDMNVEGQNAPTPVKSTTKCKQILSPAKIRRSFAMDQENFGTSN